MMKALVFHLSKKKEHSNTSLILTPFLEGLNKNGVETETIYTTDLNIKNCLLDQSCYYKTPGKCVIQDDVSILIDKAKEAKIWIFAMPVIADNAPSTFYNLLLRLVIIFTSPYILLQNNLTSHPLREDGIIHSLVLVSNCGYWETRTFAPMINYVKNFCKRRNKLLEYKGILARPHGPFLKSMIEQGESVNDIIDACRQSGIDLATKGSFNKQTLKIISRPLMSKEEFKTVCNIYISKTLEEL